MQDNGFLIEFPPEVTAQLSVLKEISPTITGPIKDLRSLLWCSIDNDDSEDLDQLSVAEATPTGVKILVAIADVDHIASKNSVYESHAKQNTTSVYTAGRIFPMLPEKLSTDITSLKFNADRLAIVAEYIVTENGTIQSSNIYPALVNNKAKLAYNSTGDWLEGKNEMPVAISAVAGLDQNLKLQEDAAKKLKSLRFINGALSLETIQARPVFQEDQVSDLEEDRPNSAKDIIQEFMICANSISARFLSSNNLPSFRRIVRVPKRWDRIVELAGEWKFKLPSQPDSKSLDDFLESAKSTDPVRFPDLSLSVIKLLGSGEYVVDMPGEESPGHFGLAIKDYTHSTAPNRRFPDLITQRLLKSVIYKTPNPYTIDELTELAAHCTATEDLAKKVERQVEKSAAALLLRNKIGQQFDGVVTGASDKGTWVRIFRPPVEGKVVSGFEGMDVGDKVHVQLMHTDVNRGFIDFKKMGK